MFDELVEEYFSDAKAFARALRLLQDYQNAKRLYPEWREFEENFLKNLGDDESNLLETVLAYKKQRDEYWIPPNRSSEVEKINTEDGRDEIEKRLEDILERRSTSHLNSIPLNEAFEKFLNDKRSNWTDDRNENQYSREVFQIFFELTGNILTTDLKKNNAIEYKEIILKMPKNRSKGRYKNCGAKDFLSMKIPENEQLANRTKSKYLQKISSFLKWLEVNDFARPALHDPLKNVISKKSLASGDRDQYTEEHLTLLFNSEDYKTGRHNRAFKFWIPLLGLFTGARENELCQLYVNDVYKEPETGIDVIDINERDKEKTGKSIKKPHHARLIPIHPELKKLGFLEYVDWMKSKKESRLFPELPYKPGKHYGDKFQRWYNRTYKNRCGITSLKVSFHSLRHTVETQLANKHDISVHKLSMLMGQVPQGGVATTTYIKPIDLKERNKIIKKLNYDGCIDFKKIRKWQGHKFTRGSRK